ncbi:MAG: NTP transferase domain-containing protein [Methyloceanibacter sp.]
MSTSLRAGLSALPLGIDGALICLGDMPWVEVPVLRALMADFTGVSAICVPVHQGRRDNPVLWGSSYFAEMMTLCVPKIRFSVDAGKVPGNHRPDD